MQLGIPENRAGRLAARERLVLGQGDPGYGQGGGHHEDAAENLPHSYSPI